MLIAATATSTYHQTTFLVDTFLLSISMVFNSDKLEMADLLSH